MLALALALHPAAEIELFSFRDYGGGCVRLSLDQIVSILGGVGVSWCVQRCVLGDAASMAGLTSLNFYFIDVHVHACPLQASTEKYTTYITYTTKYL